MAGKYASADAMAKLVEQSSEKCPERIHHKRRPLADGMMALGTSGSGYVSEWHTSTCYDPRKYEGFLEGALEKYQHIRPLPPLKIQPTLHAGTTITASGAARKP